MRAKEADRVLLVRDGVQVAADNRLAVKDDATLEEQALCCGRARIDGRLDCLVGSNVGGGNSGTISVLRNVVFNFSPA
jgi:hypothetical protein